jgi:tetratricopeptide (TPR) repeat protein
MSISLEKAVEAFRTAREAARRVGDMGGEMAAVCRIGDALRAQGDLLAALDNYRASLSIAERLTQSKPTSRGWAQELPALRDKIGDVLRVQGDLSAALESYRAGFALRARLVEAEPADIAQQHGLAISWKKIGDVLVEQGVLSDALDAYQASLAIITRLGKLDPKSTTWLHELAGSQIRLGDVLRTQGHAHAAREAYETALGVANRLVEADPSNAEFQLNVSALRDKISEVSQRQVKVGRPVSVIEFFISHASVDRELVKLIAEIIRESGGKPLYQDEHLGHADFMRKMDEAYARAGRMVVLLSGEYQKSESCRAEYNNVLGRDPANLRQRLVLLRVSDCLPEGSLQNLSYTDLVPVINDSGALKRVVKVALGFETRSSVLEFSQTYRRAGRQVLHPEVRPVRGFVGREEMLESLSAKLWSDGTTVAIRDSEEVTLALRGLGGVGKTVLARQYAWLNRERYYGVWWIRADKHETLISDLIALGARFIADLDSFEPEKAALMALDLIARMQTDKPWLLVYDNVDDQATLRDCMPAGNAHVLITTRLTQWVGMAAELPIGVFDRDAAIDFLVRQSVDKDRVGAGRLADALGRLPLALSHARAYCAERNWRFDQYLARLPALIHRTPKDAGYPDAIFATFSLAIEKASAGCADAERLLSLLAFFAPDQVPLWLIADDALSADRRDDALAALNAVSLVTLENLSDGTPAVSVHRLVQEVMRGRLARAGGPGEIVAEATRLVANGYDDSGSFEAGLRNTQLLPHALAVLPLAPREGAAASETLWATLQTGDFRVSRGELAAALALYGAGRELAERLAQADPGNARWQRDLSVSHNRIGDVEQAQGNLASALASYQASRAIAEHLAKANPGNARWQRDLSVSHNKTGDVQQAQGNLAGAFASYQASLAIRDRLAQADPENAEGQRDLSVSHNRIGEVQQAQGNLAGALASYQASLAIRDRLAQADPENAEGQRDLSVSQEKIGNVQQAQGNLAGALASYQASLAIRDRLAQADPGNAGWQRDLSVSQEKIGNVQQAQGNLAGALASYQASLAIRDRLVQADPGNAGWQRDLSVSHNNIGDVQRAQGNLAGALASYQASRVIAERLAQADPGNAGWQRDLALSHGRVGMVLAQQGQKSEGLDALRQGRTIIARLKDASADNATLPRDLAWFDAEIKRLN